MIEKNFYKYLYLSPLVLFIYMPFHVFLSTWLSTYTGNLEFWRLWKDFLTVFITLTFIAVVVLKKKYTKTFLWLVGLTALYGLIHLILLLTKNRPTDIELLSSAYNLRIFAYTIIGLSLALLLPKVNHIQKYVRVLIILSTLVCFLAFIQWILPKDILTHFGYETSRGVRPNFFIDNKPDLPRLFSTLRDPNSLGAFLILPIVYLFHKLIELWKTEKRNLFAGLLTLHVLILFLTFSRSTLLSTILAICVFVAIKQRRLISKYRKNIILIAVCLSAVLGGLFYMTKDSYFTQNFVFHADQSTVLEDPNELRIRFLADGVSKVFDEPLGYGPGSAGLVSIRSGDKVVLTENYFLQIAYEVGLFGLLVFLTILGFIVNKLWQKRTDPLAVVMIASFVGLVFANMLFHTWANEAVAIAWFMIAGMFLSEKKVPKPA